MTFLSSGEKHPDEDENEVPQLAPPRCLPTDDDRAHRHVLAVAYHSGVGGVGDPEPSRRQLFDGESAMSRADHNA